MLTYYKNIKNIKSKYKVDVDKEVPVPYKHLYVKEGNATILEIWCFKQDITFYKPLFDWRLPHRGTSFIFEDQELIRIKNAQEINDVGMPFLIIEVKSEQPNTHELLACNQKVELIKSIFPYCKSILCICGEIEARTYRHCLNCVDKIVSIEDINNIPTSFCKDIKELLQKADNEFKLIGE